MTNSSRIRFLIAVCALIGLFASVYLLYVYVSGAPIVCGLASGCELVRASHWAHTFGVPRPLLGVVFYTLLIGVLVWRATKRSSAFLGLMITRVMAAFGFIESAFLFFVQWLDVRAFCVWCLTSALMSTVIAILVCFDRNDPVDSVDPDVFSRTKARELHRYLILFVAYVPIALLGLAWLKMLPR